MIQSVDAIQFSVFGGPDVLSLRKIDLAAPGKGEIQIRHTAIGLNFIDIYHRKGVFGPKLPLPAIPGVEGVGEVVAVGADVSGFTVGDRVAYVGGPPLAATRPIAIFRPPVRCMCLPGWPAKRLLPASSKG